MSGVIFGTSNIIEKYIKDKDKDKFLSKLTEKEIELIEQIEQLEIELIKKGINPDYLSIKEVNDYLKQFSETYSPSAKSKHFNHQ